MALLWLVNVLLINRFFDAFPRLKVDLGANGGDVLIEMVAESRLCSSFGKRSDCFDIFCNKCVSERSGVSS